MRKILSIILVLPVFVVASAQKLDANKIPLATKQAFMQKYPGVDGKWEKEDGNYEVSFKKEGKPRSAVIDEKGAILETETDIEVSSLPAGIESYIKMHYKGAAIKEAAQIVKANGETIYEAEVNKIDLLFDANGKFIREAKD
jgi:hypothetical protein